MRRCGGSFTSCWATDFFYVTDNNSTQMYTHKLTCVGKLYTDSWKQSRRGILGGKSPEELLFFYINRSTQILFSFILYCWYISVECIFLHLARQTVKNKIQQRGFLSLLLYNNTSHLPVFFSFQDFTSKTTKGGGGEGRLEVHTRKKLLKSLKITFCC